MLFHVEQLPQMFHVEHYRECSTWNNLVTRKLEVPGLAGNRAQAKDFKLAWVEVVRFYVKRAAKLMWTCAGTSCKVGLTPVEFRLLFISTEPVGNVITRRTTRIEVNQEGINARSQNGIDARIA